MAWTRYVAIGDSFTEGVGDPSPDGTGWRGWADEVATRLAAQEPGVEYANLAVRGVRLDQIVSHQVPAALTLRPDLVSICAAGNDFLLPRVDPDRLAARAEEGVARIRATGADALLFTGFDPRHMRMMRRRRGRIAVYNELLHGVAERHGALLVDLWAVRALTDPRARVEDRLHLSPGAHRRVAARVGEVLGLPPVGDWRTPWPDEGDRPWRVRRRGDVEFVRRHLAPWTSQRLRGHSPGRGRTAKRPALGPVDADQLRSIR